MGLKNKWDTYGHSPHEFSIPKFKTSTEYNFIRKGYKELNFPIIII